MSICRTMCSGWGAIVQVLARALLSCCFVRTRPSSPLPPLRLALLPPTIHSAPVCTVHHLLHEHTKPRMSAIVTSDRRTSLPRYVLTLAPPAPASLTLRIPVFIVSETWRGCAQQSVPKTGLHHPTKRIARYLATSRAGWPYNLFRFTLEHLG
jgi:hypothetical protein